MIKQIIASFILAFSMVSANALGCKANDNWGGLDKREHAFIGFVAGTLGTLGAKTQWGGLAAVSVMAAGKEMIDATGRGTCSLQDFAVTVAGGVLGSAYGNLLIIPESKGVSLVYVKELK